MKLVYTRLSYSVLLAIIASNLTGCAVGKQAKTMQAETTRSINAARSKEPEPAPVVTNTSGAWLMGQTIKVAPVASPLLSKTIAYRSNQRISLADIAAYITLETRLVIDVSEVQASANTNGQPGAPGALPSGPGMMPQPMLPQMSPLPPTMGNNNAGMNLPQSQQAMAINYEGTVAGLLDVIANKASVWWKFTDGKVVFYRTETKTFYLPTNSRKSLGSSTIATSSNGTSSSGQGSSSSSGASISSDYLVDVWGDMEKTAKIVGGSAQVVANPSAGSLTVTGTPAQVRAVEEWVKGLTEQLSQQVAITVHMYRIKITNEETYNFDPTIVFKKAIGTYGFNITPSTALIPAGGQTPLSLGVSVLTGAPGAWGQYSGSQAAFQALSTLGNVSETLQQTVVTLNGQPAPIQVANQQGYLASSSTTLTASVGSTTTQTPGTVTTGFTATFLPRVVNGKIVLNMTMTNSSLISITTVGGVTSSIQTPNIDLNTFQQSVSLTPGDALLLTGLQQDKSKSNNSGVGSPTNALLGGGVNNNTDKSMIAIVISAKVL